MVTRKPLCSSVFREICYQCYHQNTKTFFIYIKYAKNGRKRAKTHTYTRKNARYVNMPLRDTRTRVTVTRKYGKENS